MFIEKFLQNSKFCLNLFLQNLNSSFQNIILEITETIQQLWLLGIYLLQDIENFAEPFLRNLDPSLFQNVILGMLALLVPVGIGILSFFFQERSKGKIASNLELFILLKRVLKADKIVTFSFCGLFLLALSKIDTFFYLCAISFFIFYVVWLFLIPFKNIWKWFLKDTKDFSISFLKNLNIKKDENTMLNSWKALWLGDGAEENEREFTKIFISHIDDAIKYRKLELAIQLSQTYLNNIGKRNRPLIGCEILPKIFKWDEKLWNRERLWLDSHDTEKKIQNFFSKKSFPFFLKVWTLKIYKKTNSKKDIFWNWNYFGGKFFQAIIKVLLKDGHGPYQLFKYFKEHIEECEKKLDEINDENEKKEYWNYITGLFASFCPTFFDNISGTPQKYEIRKHNFPQEWKITMNNIEERIPKVILNEFLQWSQERIFKNDKGSDYDKNITETINCIFPKVHSSLFTAFLMLFFSTEIKYALEKEPNFHLLGPSVSWSGSVKESKEDRDKRLVKMLQEEEISQKVEAAQIIINYFYSWPIRLPIHKDNLSEKEFKSWKSFTEEQRQSIVKRTRKEKLEKMKKEIESVKIKEICKDSERKEWSRKDFLELVELLLPEI